MEVMTSRGQKDIVNFEIAKDDFLTPLLLNIAVYNTAVAQERSIGDATIEMAGQISIKGQQPVKVDRRFAGDRRRKLAAASVGGPVAALMKSRFDDLDITGIELKVYAATDGSKTGRARANVQSTVCR
jgi:hypothetical protein